MTVLAGNWMWSEEHQSACRVVEAQQVWGESVYRIWLPQADAIVRVRTDDLKPIEAQNFITSHHLQFVASAARVADALSQDVLLAPIESAVIPLPHQIRALSRAVESDRVRYLLADEVGLGKTIEAGLIIRELKLRGLVHRVLVIAPKGLVTQWVAEMKTHFNEDFRLLIPGEFATYRQLIGEQNIWRVYDQVVCPMDSVKPLDDRRGWTREQVSEFNRERFDDLIAAGWDLVIVDEAHRLGGSTDQVARYKLGKGLAEAAPYLLLLSATPHQGKTDAFHRILALLDPLSFPDVESVSRDRVQSFVIRTEKRHAIDATGQLLFKPRQTKLIPVVWKHSHRNQQLLYEAVTAYVREGYNQAVLQKKAYIGFLMILMQRLVTSSTRAIRTTLERRLAVLEKPEEQYSLFPDFTEEEFLDLTGQEQVESLLALRLTALKNERKEVKLLLEAARSTEQGETDAKAEALLEFIYRLQQEENDPYLKILIFTEFVPTQEMLQEFLRDRGFSVICLNGALSLEERKHVQQRFAQDVRVLISTDAGGEGLNLQFCHVVVNFDIPWNPMRLEQRIGRVDRIGQKQIVRALNFMLEDTVEFRVREVLEAKLEVILEEFGVDKTEDVLDSAQAVELFESLYLDSIADPAHITNKVEAVVEKFKQQAQAEKKSLSILGEAAPLDPAVAQKMISHPLPHWVERMTVSYLEAFGGRATRQGKAWQLQWLNGETIESAVFNARDGEELAGCHHLSLEDTRIRGLAMRLGRVVAGQPIPCINLPNVSPDIEGIWSLWRIAIQTTGWNRQRILPLFLHLDGRVLQPTARHLWEVIMGQTPQPHRYLSGPESEQKFEKLQQLAEMQGRGAYDDLCAAHRIRLTREKERAETSFLGRRRSIERIGLPAVKAYRFAQLEQEEKNWRDEHKKASAVFPELTPLLFLQIEKK